MEAATTERWYCVHTAANSESVVTSRLKRQGYQIFFPRCWITWSHRGKTTSVLKPLLSRYLFAAVQGEHQSVGAINDTEGVSKVLTMCGEAYALPQRALDGLRQEFGQDGIETYREDSADHLESMLNGLGVEVAAVLLAAFGRVHSVDIERPRQPRQKRRKSRRARDLTEPAEPATSDTDAVCLVPASLPLLQGRTAESRHSMALRPCPMRIFQING